MKKLLLRSLLLLALIPFTAQAQEEAVHTEDEATVEYVLEQQIMWTRGEDGFDPGGEVTRVEFALAAIEQLYPNESFERCYEYIAPSLPPKFTKLFADVPVESWFGKRLCAAMHAGLIQGLNDGSFRPFNAITAAEASKILARSYGLVYPSLQPTDKPWFWAPMYAMEMRGAISSRTNPDAVLSRQQMATMFYALRNQQRFPRTRVIGNRTAPAPVQSADARPTQESSSPQTESEPVSVISPSCPESPVQSPGAAALVQGQSMSARALLRHSHRALREKTVGGQQADRLIEESGTWSTSCATYPARSPGAALLLQQQSAVIRPIERRSHRLLREDTRRARAVDLKVTVK